MLMIATPKLPIFRSLIARPAENCSRGGEQLTLAGEDEAAAAALLLVFHWMATPSSPALVSGESQSPHPLLPPLLSLLRRESSLGRRVLQL